MRLAGSVLTFDLYTRVLQMSSSSSSEEEWEDVERLPVGETHHSPSFVSLLMYMHSY